MEEENEQHERNRRTFTRSSNAMQGICSAPRASSTVHLRTPSEGRQHLIAVDTVVVQTPAVGQLDRLPWRSWARPNAIRFAALTW
jgi:hypothetical protein